MTALNPGEFKFNNVASTTLGNSVIQIRPEIHTPKRKVNFIPVPGVDGDYIFDEEAYENTSISLELIAKVADESLVATTKELIAYTFDTGGYKPFELYFDPNRIYYAKTLDGPNFRMSGQWPTIILYSLELSIRPFKDWSTKYTVELPNGGVKTVTLSNPSNYSSKPVITLTGSGSMKITINNIDYNLQNVAGSIVVDSQLEEAYKIDSSLGIIGANDKMFSREFPVLKTGANIITYTGATTFKIEGRWTTLVG